MTIKMERRVDVNGEEWYYLFVDGWIKRAFMIKGKDDRDRAWAAYERAKEKSGSFAEVLKEETI